MKTPEDWENIDWETYTDWEKGKYHMHTVEIPPIPSLQDFVSNDEELDFRFWLMDKLAIYEYLKQGDDISKQLIDTEKFLEAIKILQPYLMHGGISPSISHFMSDSSGEWVVNDIARRANFMLEILEESATLALNRVKELNSSGVFSKKGAPSKRDLLLHDVFHKLLKLGYKTRSEAALAATEILILCRIRAPGNSSDPKTASDNILKVIKRVERFLSSIKENKKSVSPKKS